MYNLIQDTKYKIQSTDIVENFVFVFVYVFVFVFVF